MAKAELRPRLHRYMPRIAGLERGGDREDSDAFSAISGQATWPFQEMANHLYYIAITDTGRTRPFSVRPDATVRLCASRCFTTLARISHTHYDSCTIASRSIALSN